MNKKVVITGSFLDEITADIPCQNWGEKEWDRDFSAMKKAGIERVFLIRAGFNRRLAYPSEVIPEKRAVFPFMWI